MLPFLSPALPIKGYVADLGDRLRDGLAERYQLERELGRGGMATVFLALDLRHKRPVALKVLHWFRCTVGKVPPAWTPR